MTLGQYLKQVRLELNASLADVYRDTGISQPYLCRVEKGEHIPGLKNTIELCDYYGISLYEIAPFIRNSDGQDSNT